MNSILQRIGEISLNEGITISALEKKIGASKGVLSRAIAKGTDIQAKWIQLIVENYPNYSTEWLLSGKGDMLKTERTKSVFPLVEQDSNDPLSTIKDTENTLFNIEESVKKNTGYPQTPEEFNKSIAERNVPYGKKISDINPNSDKVTQKDVEILKEVIRSQFEQLAEMHDHIKLLLNIISNLSINQQNKSITDEQIKEKTKDPSATALK